MKIRSLPPRGKRKVRSDLRHLAVNAAPRLPGTTRPPRPVDRQALLRRLESELRRLFARLHLQVQAALARELAAGVVANAFCPTGEGGGVDPSCSPGGGAGAGGVRESVGQTLARQRREEDVKILFFDSNELRPVEADLERNSPRYRQLLKQLGRLSEAAVEDDSHPVNREMNRMLVKAALSRGIRVPPEVLADYPDLAAGAKLAGAKALSGNAFCPTGEGVRPKGGA